MLNLVQLDGLLIQDFEDDYDQQQFLHDRKIEKTEMTNLKTRNHVIPIFDSQQKTMITEKQNFKLMETQDVSRNPTVTSFKNQEKEESTIHIKNEELGLISKNQIPTLKHTLDIKEQKEIYDKKTSDSEEIQTDKQKFENQLNKVQPIAELKFQSQKYDNILKTKIQTKMSNRFKTKEMRRLGSYELLAIDKKNQITSIGQGQIPASENMKSYMNNFGVTIEIPTIYVQDAKFYKKDPRYCLKLISYITPSTKVLAHNCSQNDLSKSKEPIVTVIKLIKTNNGQINHLQEVQIKNAVRGHLKFSFDGTVFCYYIRNLQQLRTIEIQHDIESVLDRISNQQFSAQFDGQIDDSENDIGFIENIDIDFNNRFVIGRGDTKIFILNIKTGQTRTYEIDVNIYEKIHNLRFVSSDDNSYQCFIALKKIGMKQFFIFDINNEKDSSKYKILNFENEPTETMKIDISIDFKQIVFVNQFENFEIIDMGTYYIQRNLNQLNEKCVRYISYSQEHDGFYFVAHHSYDHKLDVDHSSRIDFEVDFEREIEPGIIQIFDFSLKNLGKLPSICNDQGNTINYDIMENMNDKRKELRMLSLRDQEFLVDVANFKEHYVECIEQNHIHYDDSNGRKQHIDRQDTAYQTHDLKFEQYIHVPVGAFCCSWPYLVFASQNRFLMIWNVFEKRVLHQVELGQNKDSNVMIEDTYITETNDLFIITRKNLDYEIFMIDLDDSNIKEFEGDEFNFNDQFKLIKLFQYSDYEVGHKKLINIHARGSSRKEAIDNNNKLIIFCKHEDQLYSWTQFDPKTDNKQSFKKVSNIHSQEFMLIDDSRFFYLENTIDEDGRIVSQQIKLVMIHFSLYNISTVYQENYPEQIISFNIDQGQNKIIILQKLKSLEQNDLYKQKRKFLIFDLKSMKIIYTSLVSFRPLIGRLESGLYTFVDGHIYYNNNVIKIRYDLLEGPQSSQLKENEIFDYYFDIFQLEKNEKVKASTPLDSFRSHRFGYVISNHTDLKPNKVMITPYLHDNRIYLNRNKINTKYFYTSIETRKSNIIGDEKTPNHQLDDNNLDSFTSILCVNLTEYKFYVYSQSGILINRVNFRKQIDQYGIPMEDVVSSNGRIFLFKKTYEQLKNSKIELNEVYKHQLTINLMMMDLQKLSFIKQISILERFNSNLPETSWISQIDDEDILNEITFRYSVNKRYDVVIQMKSDFKNTAYFFEEGSESSQTKQDINTISVKIKGQSQNQTARPKYNYFENKLMTNEQFNMNLNYIFFYDSKQIIFFNLDDEFTDSNIKRINLKISADEDSCKIKEIRSGSNPDIIVIILDQSPTNDIIYKWRVSINAEIAFFEIGKEHQIIWDKSGEPFILTDNKVIFTEFQCVIKAFDSQQNDKMKGIYSVSNQAGHRMDIKNHNWLIQQEYLSLPFSYMTFVIMDKIEKRDPILEGNVFDLVPFNYIYCKKSSFLNGTFVQNDHQLLAQVLEKFYEIDPELIDLLNYTQIVDDTTNKDMKQIKCKMNSALAIAHQEGNNKSVEILLYYISKKKNKIPINYISLFSELLQYKNFQIYLQQLPIITIMMNNKQILHVKDHTHDGIVKITDSHSSYVDQDFFRNKMDEIKTPVSEVKNIIKKTPVQIQALKIDWILTIDGRMFLAAILRSDNLDLYQITSVQMIIEFLFHKYKIILLCQDLPLFVLQITCFFGQVYCNEIAHLHLIFFVPGNDDPTKLVYDIIKRDKITGNEHIDWAEWMLQTLNILTFLIQFFQMRLIYIQIRYGHVTGIQYKKLIRDVIFIMITISMSLRVSLMLRIEGNPPLLLETIRLIRLESVAIIPLLFIKTTDFLSLFDNISPFIDIFFKIFSDITFFMVIFMVTIFAMANCFYLIGKNQIFFDDISIDEYSDEPIPYHSLQHSIWYIILLTLGEFDGINSYWLGNQSHLLILIFLFVVAAFVMIVHMLNMLIAIMGNTYAERSPVAHNIRIRDHLKFVMENWHLEKYFIDKTQLQYIITAFEDEGTDPTYDPKQQMADMQNQIQILKSDLHKYNNLTQINQNELKNMIIGLTRTTEIISSSRDKQNSWNKTQ